ncbi:hypothetical protein Ocin01_08191 [Orchesella cincta]|uniref:Uncharacterized protein n=1 Tax=Orchesella cincta TaxID=48709 RepID=A0A1D2MZM0_ORCCI|nr:hypothetical protein Ocin01_08191 [Orchesella cincta]
MSNSTSKDNGEGSAPNSSSQQNDEQRASSQLTGTSKTGAPGPSNSGLVLDERVSQVASELIDQVLQKYNERRGGHVPNAEDGEAQTQGGKEMDKANVNELTIDELLALADCTDCVWDKNYHPCLMDDAEDNEKCKEEMRKQGYAIPPSLQKSPEPPKEVQESPSKTVQKLFPKDVQESPSKQGTVPTKVVPSKEAVETNQVKDSKTDLPRTRSSSTGRNKSGSRVGSGKSIHSRTISTSKLYDFSDSSRTKIHDANCPTKKYYDAEGYSNSKSNLLGSKSTSRTKLHGSKSTSKTKLQGSKNPSQSKISDSKNPSNSKIPDSKSLSKSKLEDSKQSSSKSKIPDSKSAPTSKPIIHEKSSKSTPNAKSSKSESRPSNSHHVQFKKEPKSTSSKAVDQQPSTQNPNSSLAKVSSKNDKQKGPPDETLEYIHKLHPHATSHTEEVARDNMIPLPFELPKREESQVDLEGKRSSHRNIHGRNSRFNPPERSSLVHQPPSTIGKQDVVCGTDKPCNFLSNISANKETGENDDTTIKELYSLGNEGKSCNWNKNYHPCSNKLNPKDKELCKQWKESNGIKSCKSTKNTSVSKSRGSNAPEKSTSKQDAAKSSKSSRSNSKTSK